MIITFCGDADFIGSEKHRKAIIDLFDSEIGENSAELLLSEI